MDLQPAKGFLFFGPPGTGKTLLAKAIAGESNVKFIYVRGPELLSKWWGESERGIRDVFALAKRHSPSILFIDELDSLGKERGKQLGDSGTGDRITNQLLKELDEINLNPFGQVVFIGATNRKHLLDSALLDRLSHQYYFGNPKTAQEKKEILEIHLRKGRKFLAKDVTPETCLKIFLKTTFSPRRVAQTIDLAISIRGKEILACDKLVKALKEGDLDRINRIKDAQKKLFAKIDELYAQRKKEEKITLEEFYQRIASAMNNPKKHPLTLRHIEQAFEEKTRDEDFEITKKMQRIYRDREPRIGKAYGLAVQKGEFQRGTIVVVEAKIFPRSSRKENLLVYGTVNDSIKDSAGVALDFLRDYCPGISEVDISIHIVSVAEGRDLDPEKISGPSLGMAITMALASRWGEIPLNPSVCVTGKVELLDGKAGLVGGIHPWRGSGKLDIAIEEKFETVIVPLIGYEMLKKDYPEYIKTAKELGTKIIGKRDFFEFFEISSGLKTKEIKERLKRGKPGN